MWERRGVRGKNMMSGKGKKTEDDDEDEAGRRDEELRKIPSS